MRDFKGDFAPGSMLHFEIDTDDGKIHRLCRNNCHCLSFALSLGNVATLLENPYNMTHLFMSEEEKAEAGIKRSGIRMSVGLEDPDDIIRDLKEALDQV